MGIIVVVHCVFFFFVLFQRGEYFLKYVGAFCLVVSLPLSKEDAFHQDGPKLHFRFLL